MPGICNSHNVSPNCIFTPTDLPAINSSASPLFDTDLIPQEDILLQNCSWLKGKDPSALKKGQGEEFLPLAF